MKNRVHWDTMKRAGANPHRSRAGLTAMTVLSLTGWLVAGAFTPTRAQSAPATCDRFVARTLAVHPTSGWSSVIVRFRGDLTAVQAAQVKMLAADTYRSLPIIHSAAMRLPSRNLAKLANLPFVTHISADVEARKTDEFTVGRSGADIAFNGYGLGGDGIGVAVIDSGVHESAADLQQMPGILPTSRVIRQVNFASDSDTTVDLCGHGTHVAGIIAGNGAASSTLLCYRTFYGIARQANIVSVRVLDSQGEADVSTVIAGIQWAVAKKNVYNIRVINLSLGHSVGESYTTDPLCQAVEQAWKAGIVVVCAAGNDGRLNSTPSAGQTNEGYGTAYGSINSPGNDPYVITVGAMKQNPASINSRSTDLIATYSSRGPSRLDLVLKPDIVAPGNRIISLCDPDGVLEQDYASTNDLLVDQYKLTRLQNVSRTYFVLSGTSMATPVVSGAAALLLQANPGLSPDTVKARLMFTADKWDDPSGNADACTYGAGYLDIPAALRCTLIATQSAMSPSLTLTPQGNVTINMDHAIWGKSAIWGTGVSDLHAIWGKSAISATGADLLGAANAIWGNSVVADHAIWGKDTAAADISQTAIQGE